MLSTSKVNITIFFFLNKLQELGTSAIFKKKKHECWQVMIFVTPDKTEVGPCPKMTSQVIHIFITPRLFSLNIEKVIRKVLSSEYLCERSKYLVGNTIMAV